MDFINTSNRNFGSIPLYRAVLKQRKLFGQARPIEAIVSLAEKTDLDRLDLNPQRWILTEFGYDVIQDMERMSPSYAKQNYDGGLLVEIPSKKPGKQVKAMASFSTNSDDVCVNVLQTKREILPFNRTKGAGSLIMYAISKIAQEKHCPKISLFSAPGSTGFYKKMGFKRNPGRFFDLSSSKFEDFQRRLEEKFQIKEIAKA